MRVTPSSRTVASPKWTSEYPSSESSAVKRFIPRFASSDHGVERGQQLAHASHQGELGQLASGLQTLVEGLDGAVVARVRERGHVQHTPFLEAPDLYPSPALAVARVVGHGRHTHQRRHLAPLHPTAFG